MPRNKNRRWTRSTIESLPYVEQEVRTRKGKTRKRGVEEMLRDFRRRVQKSGVLEQARDNMYFTKPSDERRAKRRETDHQIKKQNRRKKRR